MSEQHDAHTLHGVHAVQEALASRPEQIEKLWLNAGRHDQRLKQVQDQARQVGVAWERLGSEAFQKVARKNGLEGSRHQGVIARVKAIATGQESDLEALLLERDRPLLLVLDGVTDPHNLGACLRTADATGVDAVIVPKKRSAGLTATVAKVASGAAEHVPLIQVTNLARKLTTLRAAGVWVTGLADAEDGEIYDAPLSGPTALVLGAEGEGLRRLTREHCDHLVRIPMLGRVSSLNVSVAAGVCLYEALRQRRLTADG